METSKPIRKQGLRHKETFQQKEIQTKGSISLAIREMQIKITMISLHTPMRKGY